MKDEESKQHAKAALEAQGFVVEPIGEANHPGQRRADLLVRWSTERYVVEAKGKQATAQYNALVKEARRNGQSFLGRELQSWNGLSSILKEAEEQLVRTAQNDHDIRVVWLSCLNADAHFVFEAFKRRIFGQRTVTVWEPPGPKLIGARICFYYDFCDFFRYRGIDAAVLAQQKCAQFLVNEFSERAELVRQSHLYTILSAGNAVIDPSVLEAKGRAFVIRADIDRSGTKAQWEYIRKTYGCLTSVCTQYESLGLVCIGTSDILGQPS